jgi:hypothetical protein
MLLGQLQFSPNPRIREVVRKVLRDCAAPLAKALAARLPPDLAPARVISRLYFVLGVGAYAAMSWDDMVRSVSKHFGPGATLDAGTVTDEIVRFCAAGLRASAEEG